MHCKIHGWLNILFIILNGLQPGMSGTCNKPIEKNTVSSPPKTSWKQYLTSGIAFSWFGSIPIKELGNLGAEFGPLSLHFLPAAYIKYIIKLSVAFILQMYIHPISEGGGEASDHSSQSSIFPLGCTQKGN